MSPNNALWFNNERCGGLVDIFLSWKINIFWGWMLWLRWQRSCPWRPRDETGEDWWPGTSDLIQILIVWFRSIKHNFQNIRGDSVMGTDQWTQILNQCTNIMNILKTLILASHWLPRDLSIILMILAPDWLILWIFLRFLSDQWVLIYVNILFSMMFKMQARCKWNEKCVKCEFEINRKICNWRCEVCDNLSNSHNTVKDHIGSASQC